MFKAVTILVSVFLFNTSSQAHEVENSNITVQPFTAYYNIIHNDKPVGTGKRQLVKREDGLYEYSYSTNISWLIFSDERKEVSVVTIDGHHVTPKDYQFKRTGTGSDKHYHWKYNNNANSALNVKKKKSKTIDFPDNFQDKLSYHLQNRINLIANPSQRHFVYPVVSNSGKIKNYVYQYDGVEDVMLPYGLVKTIRLKREVIEKNKTTYAWFAPEHDYMLVKLRQIKEGVQQFEAQLTKIE